MSNLSALQLVAVHMDTATLELISKTPLWTVISPLFSNQHFWYLRAQTCVNFPLEWNSQENWYQVYNILDSVRNYIIAFPIEALEREVNGYNYTAVKILLKLGCDPTLCDCYSLIPAVKYGSPEVLRLLFSDSRVNPTSARLERALNLATELGRLDMIEVLVSIIQDGKKKVALTCLGIAIAKDNVESLKLLMRLAQNAVNSYLAIAVTYGSLNILKFLMQLPNVDLNGGCSHVLEHAISNRQVDAIKLLLSDERIVITDLVASRAGDSSREIKSLIFSDLRISPIVLTSYLRSSEDLTTLYTDALNTIIRRKDIDLRFLQHSNLLYITWSIEEYLRPCMEACIKLSHGLYNRDSLMELISNSYRCYDTHHYQMLLRELILKRQNLDYYFKWVSKRCRNSATKNVRRVIRCCMNGDTITHLATFCTAYRAFSMLKIESDKSKILELVSKEEGVTQEGLQLAGALLGAYTG